MIILAHSQTRTPSVIIDADVSKNICVGEFSPSIIQLLDDTHWRPRWGIGEDYSEETYSEKRVTFFADRGRHLSQRKQRG